MVVFCLWAVAARAQMAFTAGNALYEHCTGDTSQQASCLSYIAGVADSTTCELLPPGFGWRPDSHMTLAQLQKVVVAFLIAHPEELHMQASGLVQEALTKAFPCK